MYKTPERLAFDKELGAALKRARIVAGLTRNDVSLDTDLNPSSIDRIERGQSSANTFDVLRIMASIGAASHGCQADPLMLLREALDAGEARFVAGKIWGAK